MPAFDVPLELEERLKSLGEPIAEFRTGFGKLAVLWAFTAGAFVAGLGLVLFLVYAAVFVLGQAHMHVATMGKLGILGLVLLSAGVRGVQRIRKTKGVRVFCFEDGLARVQGESVAVLRWEDVAIVQRASLTTSERGKMQPARKLILTGRDGAALELDDSLSDLRTLRELVEQHTLAYLFPPILDAYERGEAVSFGKLSVSREGVHSGRKTLPWSECEDVEAAQGHLTIKAQGAWLSFCKVPLHELANVHILLALAEYIRKYAA